MENNDFMIELSALLNQSKSKKQINSDIKQLEQSLNALKLTATFAKADTKRELNAYIKQLDGQLATVKLRAKMDQAQLKRDINNTLKNVQLDDIRIKEHGAGLKLRKIYTDFKRQTEKNPVSIDFTTKKQTLQNQLSTFLSKNSKIRESSVLLKEADKLRDIFDNIDSKDSVKSATEQLRLFKSECTATGYTSKSTTDRISDMVKGAAKIGSTFGVANIAIQNYQKSLQTLKNNSTILVEISKTSEMNKKQLTELGNSSFDIASKYGQLSSNYLLGVQEMARSGYEETSKELGELSLLAQSAGDMTAEMANNYLLATDAAYKYSGSIEKLNAALDGANFISNRNSASLTDIADAIRVSASFASNAGIGIDELTAAESTMVAATKRSGSEMGRAFRSIILNLQGVSGEFDGEVIDDEQLEKVEKRCHSLGVELEYMKDGMATLRNPMEVLKDLAEVYNSLPDNNVDKQGLISDLGGKYNANGLSALLSRWDLYEKMLSEYSQGAGSSLIEAEKTANSWEGKLNSLQNSWDSFVNTLTNKEAIVSGISIFDRLIQGAEKLTDVLGALPVIMTTVGTGVTALNKDYGITQVFNKDKKKLDIQGNIFGINFTAIKSQKQHMVDAESAIAKWNNRLIAGKSDINKFNESVVQNSAQLKAYLETCSKDAPASLEGYKSFLHAAGESTDALRLKTVLLNSALTLVTSIGIQGAITLVSKMITSHQEMVETLNTTAQSFDKENQSIEENKAKIIELKTALDSGNLSYSDAVSKRNELLTIQSSLIESYGSEAGGIDLVNGSLEEQIGLLDKVNNRKLQEAVNKANEYNTGQKITNVFENFSQYLRNIFDGNFSKEAWTWDNNALGTNLENATAEMEGFSAKFNALDNGNLNKIIGSFKEISRLGDTFYIRGNAEDVKNTVSEIQEQLGSSTEYTDELNSQLTDIYNKADKALSDYQEGYNLAKMQEIAKDEMLSDYYNEITEAYNKYEDSMTSGDEELTAQTLQNYSELLQAMSNDESVSNSMFRYFTEMYPELKDEVKNWKFETKITPELDVEDSDINSNIKQLSTFTIEDLSRKYYKDIINGTSAGLTDIQIDALMNIQSLADECDMTLDEFFAKLNEAGKLQSQVKQSEILEPQIIDLSNVTSQVTSLTSSYESLNTAISEQNENGTISSETLAKLQENYENIAGAIEITSNGIILNANKLAELNKNQKEAIKSGFAQAEEELAERFNENSVELAYYNELLENNNGITEYNGQSLEELIAAKQADQDATEGQIAELQSLQLEYENATSKHNMFIQSLSSKDAGSMYDDIVSALDTVQKEWDNGNYGKDEIRNFVDYMSYDDMSTASIEEIKNAYQSAMDEANKYYTETTEGQQNFLNLLKETKVNGEALATVDTDGNWTISIDDMDEAAKACGKSVDFLQDNLNKLKDKGFEIEFETDNDNLVDVQSNLDAINNRIAEIKVQINAGDSSPKLKEELAELENSKVEIEIAVNQQKAIQEIQSLQAQMVNATPDVQAQLQQKQAEIANTYNLDLQSVLTMDTSSADNEVDGLTERVKDLDLSTTIKVDANTNLAKSAIDSVTSKSYTAKINLEVNGTKFSSQLKSIIENAANKTGDTNSSSSGAGAYGTVNIKGNAHANGTIGTSKKQKNVMVSEVKPEMVVDPHNGEYTIYQNPTMLTELPQNAIVFNGDQTEEILKNGMTTSFGKAYVNGNVSGKAYKTGTSGSGNLNAPSNSTSSSTSSSTKSKKSSTKKATEEVFDWIERRVTRFQRQFDKWLNRAETALTSGFIEKYYDKAAARSKSLMTTYDKAYERYIKQANKSGLSSKYKKLVQQGKIDISTITNETLKKQIQDYQTWYEKAQESVESFLEEVEKFYHLPLDEAATKIEKFNDAIDLLDATLDNITVNNYKDANKNIDSQIAEQKKILDAQNTAKTKADSNLTSAKKALDKSGMLNSASGVTAAEKKKIQAAIKNNEEIDTSLFKANSAGYNAAVKYNEALKAQAEATQEAKLAQQEYLTTVRELEKEKFDNIQNYYEKQAGLLDNQITSIDNRISEIETAGKKVNRSYYDAQLKLNNAIKAQYEEEKKQLEAQLSSIPKGTEEWYDAVDAIQECADSISECVQETYNLNNAINELRFSMFKDTADAIDRIITEQEFLQGLFAHENMTDSDTGNFTEAGIAKLGSLSSSYYAAKEKADNDAELLKELQNVKANGKQSDGSYKLGDWTFNSLDDLQAKIDEVYTTWQSDITETYNLETNIADLMKDRYQAELDLLKELITQKKEALDAEKDLHDYQQSIQEKTKDITTIQKQIAAISGDSSQEGLAKLQKLQAELSEKEDDLRETEYERYIQDQQDILDKLSEEYEELMTKKLEDFMTLVREGLQIGNENTSVISSYLSQIAGDNGYTEETKGLFTTVSGSIEKSTQSIIAAIEKRIAENSGTKSDGQGDVVAKDAAPATTATTTANTNDAADSYIADKFSTLQPLNSATQSTKLTATSTSKSTSTQGDGKVQTGDKVTFKSGKYYTSSDGSGSSGNKNLGKSVYVTKVSSGAKKPYHISTGKKLGSGDLGWVLKNQLSGYAKGAKKIKEDEMAWTNENGNAETIVRKSDHAVLTPLSKDDRIYNALSSDVLWDFANDPDKFIESIKPITPDLLQPLVTLPDLSGIQPVNSMGNIGNVVNIDNITLPNVTNYEEFRTQMFQDMQRNNKFEKMIQDMTIKRALGENSLTKYKYRF